MAGVGVGLLYKYYYTGGDTWNYFYQAEKFSQIAFQSWSSFTKLVFYSDYQLVMDLLLLTNPERP